MSTLKPGSVRLRVQDAGPTSDPFGPGGGDILVAEVPAGRQYRVEKLPGGGLKIWMLPPSRGTADGSGLPSAAEIQRRNRLFWDDRNGKS